MRALATGTSVLMMMAGIPSCRAAADCTPYALQYKNDSVPFSFGNQTSSANATLDVTFTPGAPYTPKGSDTPRDYSNALLSVTVEVPEFKTLIDQSVLPQMQLPNNGCGEKIFLHGHRISLSLGQIVVSDHFDFEYWQCTALTSQIADGSFDTTVYIGLGIQVLPSIKYFRSGPLGLPVPQVTYTPELIAGITPVYGTPTVHILYTGIWTIDEITSNLLGWARNLASSYVSEFTQGRMKDITSTLGAQINSTLDRIIFSKSNNMGGSDDTLTKALNLGDITDPSFGYMPAATSPGNVNDFGPNDSVLIEFYRKGGIASRDLCNKQAILFGEPAVARGLDAALTMPFPKCFTESLCQ